MHVVARPVVPRGRDRHVGSRPLRLRLRPRPADDDAATAWLDRLPDEVGALVKVPATGPPTASTSRLPGRSRAGRPERQLVRRRRAGRPARRPATSTRCRAVRALGVVAVAGRARRQGGSGARYCGRGAAQTLPEPVPWWTCTFTHDERARPSTRPAWEWLATWVSGDRSFTVSTRDEAERDALVAAAVPGRSRLSPCADGPAWREVAGPLADGRGEVEAEVRRSGRRRRRTSSTARRWPVLAGRAASSARADSAQRTSSARASAIAGDARRRPSASACRSSSTSGSASSSRRRAPAGSVPRSASRTGSVRMPSRRSVPGVLPDSSDSLAMSSRSSESWNATPNFSPYAEIACGDGLRRAGRHRAHAAGSSR